MPSDVHQYIPLHTATTTARPKLWWQPVSVDIPSYSTVTIVNSGENSEETETTTIDEQIETSTTPYDDSEFENSTDNDDDESTTEATLATTTDVLLVD